MQKVVCLNYIKQDLFCFIFAQNTSLCYESNVIPKPSVYKPISCEQMNLFNSEYREQEKRWLWLDYDKGISIILVGYGHCLATLVGHAPDLNDYTFFNYTGAFLYGFRMPLFFIVSGMLIGKSLQKKGFAKYIADRINNILYPLLVWGFIEISLQIMAAQYTTFTTGETVSSYNYLQLLIQPRATGHFWYLNTLFCIGVVYATLKAKLKFTPAFQLILGSAFYVIFAYISLSNIEAGLLTDICKYYFFFALGDFVSKQMLDERNRRVFSTFTLFIPLVIVFIITQYYFANVNLQHAGYGNQFVEQKMPFFYLFESLVGCAASVSFSFLLQRYKVFTWISDIGCYSLYIYLMQIIVMAFARVLFQNLLHITYVPALILLIWITGVLLPVFLYRLCMRCGMWWLFSFRRPKESAEPALA